MIKSLPQVRATASLLWGQVIGRGESLRASSRLFATSAPTCMSRFAVMVPAVYTQPCRNMSLWFMAKKKVQRAWSKQVKIDSDATIQHYGVEIGTAHLLVRLGAQVQFSNGQWYSKKDLNKGLLPVDELRGGAVIAIDAQNTDIDLYSMANIVKLTQVKYLSLEGCELVDDHCLASLVHIRDSLTHLNINRCSAVTENGVATLHKLRLLERLNMNDMPKVNHAPLVAVMLEDVLPRLHISLVTRQVERYAEEARRGMSIIEEERRKIKPQELVPSDRRPQEQTVAQGTNDDAIHQRHSGAQMSSKTHQNDEALAKR